MTLDLGEMCTPSDQHWGVILDSLGPLSWS